MKITYMIAFFFVAKLLFSQDFNCNTEFLGKYIIVHKSDSIDILFLGSKTCEKNNIAIIDNKACSGTFFEFNDSVNFANCKTNIDSLIWIYFFIDKYSFDIAKCKTSKPYSNKEKKNPKYFYNTEFNLDDSRWVVSFTLQNTQIVYLKIFKDLKISGRPLCEKGVFIKLTEL